MSEQDPPRNGDVSEQNQRVGRGGRPAYKPTDEQRVLVRQLVADDKTMIEIAQAVGISRVTLRKYFGAELAKPGLQQGLPLEGGHVPTHAALPPGRPEFEPTFRQREDVRLWKADDWSDDRIARQLGISRNTLLKHFAEELDYGVDHVRARVLRNLMRESDAGSVSASDRLLKLPGMLAPVERLPSPPPENETPAPQLGKKEAARIAAQTAEEGTSWAGLLKH